MENKKLLLINSSLKSGTQTAVRSLSEFNKEQKYNIQLLYFLSKKNYEKLCDFHQKNELSDGTKRGCFYPW
ncbi:hypothetical protein LCGC14_2788210 [marine sediment metagenome]|uniref:Uncharacterized protein n=1 Tax=marine sediment metagenome TaxID=412755 RepID=A0A0F8YRD4_9ZZZZ